MKTTRWLTVLALGVFIPQARADFQGMVIAVQGHCAVVRTGPGYSFLAMEGDYLPKIEDRVEGPLLDLGSQEFEIPDVAYTFEAYVSRAGARKSEIGEWYEEEGCDYEDNLEYRPDEPDDWAEEDDWPDDMDTPGLDEDQGDLFEAPEWGQWEEEENDEGYLYCDEESDGFDNDYGTDQDCIDPKEEEEDDFPFMPDDTNGDLDG